MSERLALQDNTLYFIGEIEKMVRNRLVRVIREQGYDISPEQFTILVLLWYNDGMTQSELIEKVGRDKTTVSRVLSRMLKNKLISRADDPDNRRINRIHITPKGKAIQDVLIGKAGPIYLQAMDGVEPTDAEVANKVLRRIFNNLSK